MVWHVVPQTRHRPGFQALASGTLSLHRSQRPLSLLRFRPEPLRGTLTVATLDPPIGHRHRTATLNGAQVVCSQALGSWYRVAVLTNQPPLG